MSARKAEGYRLLAQGYALLAEAEDLVGPYHPGAAAEELLTVRTSGVEANAVRRLIADGLLPAARLGRKLYFKRSDLLAVVDSRSQAPKNAAHPESAPDSTPPIAETYARLVERTRHPSKRSLAAIERERKKKAAR